MTMRVRAVLMLLVALATIGLASCDHYNCSTGPILSGSCTASATGLGSGGTTGSATAAFVFVSDGAGTGTAGTIDGYTLNTTASTFAATPSYTAPSTPLLDSGVGMVVAQAQFLYTGFASTNQIFGWSIGADGTLTAVNGSPYSVSFMDFVPAGFGTQSIITNPAGTLLFFSTFQDNIYVYQIGSGGVLTAAAGSPFSAPFSGNLATDGLGKYLYITDANDHAGSQIAAYSIGTSGSLTAVQGSPFAFPMWQVQGDPTGKFLIGTTGHSVALNGTDDDHLYVFGITQAGTNVTNAGAIAPVTGSPFATQFSPLSIAVQSNTSGNLVYSFGLADSDLAFNPVEGYELGSTGTLTLASGSPFSDATVGDLGQLDQSGAFLFVYGGIFNTSTNTITYQLGAFDVGSGGTLTQPTSTLTLPAGGFFAVTDPL
jgi:6-phosphogluconolactonase